MAATAISAGADTTCALLSDGTVRCWGLASGFQPQLGNSSTPVPLAGLPKPASQISVGGTFGCALLNDTTVWCWGGDAVGQLGHNMVDTSGSNSGPLEVLNLPAAATAVAAGNSYACVILSNATVWCWGDNEEAQLGTGTPTTDPPLGSSMPVQAGLATLGLGGPASLATGDQTTYVVTNGTQPGALAAWGDDSFTELGNLTLATPGMLVTVPMLGKVVSVAAGSGVACAILTDGTVWCWGNDNDGALGSGDTQFPDDAVPGQVVDLPVSSAISVAVGGTSACTILQNNTLWCWGQLEASPTPVQVTGFTGTPARVTVGLNHACVLTSNGSVWCWGSNNLDGQLGNGSPQSSAIPQMVVPW
jgi:alpha-tubulin suppressor-like RCC1 family protein